MFELLLVVEKQFVTESPLKVELSSVAELYRYVVAQEVSCRTYCSKIAQQSSHLYLYTSVNFRTFSERVSHRDRHCRQANRSEQDKPSERRRELDMSRCAVARGSDGRPTKQTEVSRRFASGPWPASSPPLS